MIRQGIRYEIVSALDRLVSHGSIGEIANHIRESFSRIPIDGIGIISTSLSQKIVPFFGHPVFDQIPETKIIDPDPIVWTFKAISELRFYMIPVLACQLKFIRIRPGITDFLTQRRGYKIRVSHENVEDHFIEELICTIPYIPFIQIIPGFQFVSPTLRFHPLIGDQSLFSQVDK